MSEKIENLEAELRGFTGTSQYHKANPFVVHTDGIQFLAEKAGAYWIIDVIGSYQARWKEKAPFQVWTLMKAERGAEAVIMMQEDSGEPALVVQDIPYTDFPLDDFEGLEFKCYCINSGDGLPVVMLPSEY